MNPLQAQFQSGIQSQAPVDERTNLQRQQLNIGRVAERMDGPTAQMLAVDPNMYADRKQARDFQALNQERQRQQDILLSDRQNQQALAREKLRYDNQIAIGKANAELQRQLALDAERRALDTYKQKQKDAIDQQRTLQILRNEQFADLREPAGRVMAKKNAWDSGGAEKYVQDAYTSLMQARANNITPDQVKKAWESTVDVNGNTPTPGSGPKMGTAKYKEIQMRILQSQADFGDIQADTLREAQKQAYAVGQQINGAYTAVTNQITKLGYSPSMDANYTPVFGGSVTPSGRTQLRPPPASGGVNIPALKARAAELDKDGDGIADEPGILDPFRRGNIGAIGRAVTNPDNLPDSTTVVGTVAAGWMTNVLSKGWGKWSKSGIEKSLLDKIAPLRKKYPSGQVGNLAKLKERMFQDTIKEYGLENDPKLKNVDLKNLKAKDMAEIIAKRQDGIVTKLAKKFPKVFKDKKTGKFKVPEGMKKLIKAGGITMGAIAVNDYFRALGPEERQELLDKINKEIRDANEGTSDLKVAAEVQNQVELIDERAQLRALKEGNTTTPNPLTPNSNTTAPSTAAQRYLNDGSVFSSNADDAVRRLLSPTNSMYNMSDPELLDQLTGYYKVEPELAQRLVDERNRRRSNASRQALGPMQYE